MAECKFCGQMCLTATSDEEATRACKCADAAQYTIDQNKILNAAETREKALINAKAQIKHLFAGGGEGYGWLSVSEELETYMLRLAELIYDEKIDNATLSLTANNKMICQKTAKGKLRIQRKDTITNQAEI